jgi:predicted DCC family thiol-disulfide oxidoreductase YuxK
MSKASTKSTTRGFRAFSPEEDPAIPAFPTDRPIIIFDGHCVLCSGFARFVLRHDKRAIFRLMAGQSPLGQSIYRHLGLDAADFETNILLYQGKAWFKSRGTIQMFYLLGFPWSSSVLLRIVPTVLLDRLYAWFARNRFRWFGRREQCFLMDPAHRDRFLE